MRSELALFRHHRQLTARLAGRLGSGEAEDLASEAVVRSLARPAPDGRQAPWLETIFRHLLADRSRRWGRRGQPATLAGDVGAGAGAETIATPEELVLAAERARAVANALPAMPAELREAVEARFFAEQDYDEIAACRGITRTTARTRVHRGLARLRQALAGVRALLPAMPGGPAVGALAPAVAVAVLAIAPGLSVTPVMPVDGAPAAVVSPAGERGRGERRMPRLIADSDVGTPRLAAPPARTATTLRHAEAATKAATKAATATAEDDAPAAVRHMEFDEDEVEGELQRPGMILIDGDPRQRRMGSLIEIPRSFEPSMTKMIEDL